MFVCVQEEKVYVQHHVRENAQLLWDLIANKSGCFYIAGWVQRSKMKLLTVDRKRTLVITDHLLLSTPKSSYFYSTVQLFEYQFVLRIPKGFCFGKDGAGVRMWFISHSIKTGSRREQLTWTCQWAQVLVLVSVQTQWHQTWWPRCDNTKSYTNTVVVH